MYLNPNLLNETSARARKRKSYISICLLWFKILNYSDLLTGVKDAFIIQVICDPN